MAKKKEEVVKVKRKINIHYISIGIGFIAGVILMLIISLILYSSGYVDEGQTILEEKKVTFTLNDVHLDAKDDFKSGEAPHYDSDYCNAKYTQKYQQTAGSCYISNIMTASKMNPEVRDVECVCFS